MHLNFLFILYPTLVKKHKLYITLEGKDLQLKLTVFHLGSTIWNI